MPNAQPLVTSRWNLSSGKAIVLLSAFFVLVVQLILFQPILRDYFPTFDELALLSSSTDIGGATEPAKWFTEGYRYYFFSDQEWPWMRQTTDFMRPGGNFIYWVCYNLFGEHWSAQLVLGYFAHALCVGLVGYIARTLFQLERWWILLAMVLAAFNPAYWWGDDFSLALPWAVQFPAYQTEVMAGLLDLAAFIVFVRRRFILFSVLVTLSLLIKETAITLPLSALLIAGCWRGDTAAATLRNATWLVLPLILWGVLRFIVHEPGGGMYVLHSDRLWIIAPIRHLLMWPTAVDAPLRETVDLLHRHEWFTLSVRALAILMNLVWWAVLGFIAWRVVRTWGNRWLTAAPPPWVIGLVFALGNLGAAVMLQISEPRFGYLWFALGPAAVLVAVSRWKAGPLAAGALSLSLLIAPVSALIDTCSQDMLVHQRTVRQSARQLVSLVRDLPPSVENRVHRRRRVHAAHGARVHSGSRRLQGKAHPREQRAAHRVVRAE
ncbi:MAG: hypothetical protein WDO56_14325 [Gammaproteobacteria bacterium]